jgi:3-isopropylmalate dehydrogenase
MLTRAVFDPSRPVPRRPFLIGALPGEGVGPAVVEAALEVLAAVGAVSGHAFEVRFGGAIGLDAIHESGQPLSAAVTELCEEVFAAGGAVLAGPGGSRFVYDMRRTFSLFCKLNPVHAFAELCGAGRLRPEAVAGVDLVVVRENLGGLYQGESSREGGRVAHTFGSSEEEARQILDVGARLAVQRGGRMTVVIKDSGLPALSALWREQALAVAADAGVGCSFLDIDYAVYQLLQDPRSFDVLVAPNCFGDILADLGGVLMGSRGLTYGASYASTGAAIYQTNHGAAYDLAGMDRANPAGQILSLAMMLRESFGLPDEAGLVEEGLRQVWREGWRTADVWEAGCRMVGTREMARRVAAVVSSADVPASARRDE